MHLSENIAILIMSVSIGLGAFLVINSVVVITGNEAQHFARDVIILVAGLLVATGGIVFVSLTRGSGASSFDSARAEFIAAVGVAIPIALTLAFITQGLMAAIRHHRHKSA